MCIRILVLSIVLFLTACASNSQYGQHSADPYESVNRKIFAFNHGIDNYVLKPVAKGYRKVTPNTVEKGVNNFFSNLLEIRNIINASLQGKGHKSLDYTGRFIINSSFGLFGLFDIAGEMGLEKDGGEDFGQTLATWGVGSGPYLVLPLLGPSTVRDGLAIPVNQMLDPKNYVSHRRTSNALTGGNLINTRAQLLDVENLVTGDRYSFLRDAYLQRRQYLINDGKNEDTFEAELDDF